MVQPYVRANHGSYIELAAPGVTAALALVLPTVAASAEPQRAIVERFADSDLGAAGRDPDFGRGPVLAPSCVGRTVTAPTQSR